MCAIESAQQASLCSSASERILLLYPQCNSATKNNKGETQLKGSGSISTLLKTFKGVSVSSLASSIKLAVKATCSFQFSAVGLSSSPIAFHRALQALRGAVRVGQRRTDKAQALWLSGTGAIGSGSPAGATALDTCAWAPYTHK
ncbi:hypothetical protein MHYP_G00166810 [Metynnis hypsauchen]